MGLLEKFDAVTVDADNRITAADKAFCEKHQAAYETALTAFHEFSFFWADMVKAQRELLQEEEDYKNEKYLDASGGVKVDEDRIRNNIECLHGKLIGTLVAYFNATYNVSVDSYEVEKQLVPQEPSYYAKDEKKNAYHEKMDALVLNYRDVVDQIILRLSGRSFSEQADYEIKEACRNAVWDYHSKNANFTLRKSVISLSGYFCSYNEVFNTWTLSSDMRKVLYALAHYEAGAAGIYPWGIRRFLDECRMHMDTTGLGDCEKVTKLKMYKNGRVDITFASPDCAKCFAKEYFGEQWDAAAA